MQFPRTCTAYFLWNLIIRLRQWLKMNITMSIICSIIFSKVALFERIANIVKSNCVPLATNSLMKERSLSFRCANIYLNRNTPFRIHGEQWYRPSHFGFTPNSRSSFLSNASRFINDIKRRRRTNKVSVDLSVALFGTAIKQIGRVGGVVLGEEDT